MNYTDQTGQLVALAGSSLQHLFDTIYDRADVYDKVVKQNTNPYGMKMAMGGKIDVEAEGEELVQVPGKPPMEIKGPKHEKGGVDMEVPEGTTFFSDRLKGPDGKTMAERKKRRERLVKKQLKEFMKDPFNAINRSSLEQTLVQSGKEEAADVLLMDMARKDEEMDEKEEAKCGGKMGCGGKVKMKAGGTAFGEPEEDEVPEEDGVPLAENIFNAFYTGQNAFVEAKGPELGGIDEGQALRQEQVKENADKTLAPRYGTENTTTLPLLGQGVPIPGGVLDYFGMSEASAIQSNGTYNFENDTPFNPDDSVLTTTKDGTGGGMNMGDFWNRVGAYGPLATTIANRLGDKPNPNYFENYGVDALQTNAKSFQELNAAEASSLRDIAARSTAARETLDNTARSVGTKRAMSLAQFTAGENAARRSEADFAGQRSRLYSERAGLQNQADAQRMQGAERAGIADIQDRDNFYTQLSKNIGNLATQGMQYSKMQKFQDKLDSGELESMLESLYGMMDMFGTKSTG